MQFTLRQLLMGTALAAILLSLALSEGCGRRFGFVHGIAFLPSGRQIVVSRIDARDANVSMKLYFADVSRTISLLETTDGSQGPVVCQDVRRGDRGPSTMLWDDDRPSFAVSPTSGDIVVTGFGEPDLRVYPPKLDQPPRVLRSASEPIRSLAISSAGDRIAAATHGNAIVIDVATNRIVANFPPLPDFFAKDPAMSFSPDARRLATYDPPSLQVWDTTNNQPAKSFSISNDFYRTGVAVLADGSLISCGESALVIHSPSGNRMPLLSGRKFRCFDVSRDDSFLVVTHDAGLTLLEVQTQRVVQDIPLVDAWCVKISPDKTRLAVSVGQSVTLLDVATGAEVWRSTPVGRRAWSYLVPLAFLAAWIGVYRRLFGRQSRQEPEKPTYVTAPDEDVFIPPSE